MSRLKFNAASLRRVVEHALAAKEHSEGYGGDKGDVILVHDDGVYLMSAGRPRDILSGKRSFVVYAEGCNPLRNSMFWETSRDLVGGDDFAEYLPWAKALKELIDAGEDEIIVQFGAKSIAITSQRKRSK